MVDRGQGRNKGGTVPRRSTLSPLRLFTPLRVLTPLRLLVPLRHSGETGVVTPLPPRSPSYY